ncbi:hypothetical protein CANMA_001962 [Candida margitis]|uniref:uncharacterized protein n=1 Tax=Candida margitis TaxID=1775924 RepID=UPI002225F64E|nr:uncharacterized protein CANMA_001962 [Candida margitis]KAI5968966.1 hypothetical protein CANMA_001962 [Candida margitis]
MAPNRREEIKQKQELQARFQFSISQNNARAMNWLKPISKTDDTESKSEETSSALHTTQGTNSANSMEEDVFSKLRVIPQGAGLSSKTTQTIGDFLNSKDINQQKTSDNSTTSQKVNGSGRGGGGSVAMKALLNKMRNETRKELNQSRHTNQGSNVQQQQQQQQSTNKVNGKKGRWNDKGFSRGAEAKKADTAVSTAGFDSDSESDDDIKALKSRSASKINKSKVGKKARPF